MATYDIDKITLPSGDVCNLTIPDASAVQAGKVNTDTTTAQLFRGIKVFDSDTITVANGSSHETHNYSQIQFNDKTFSSNPDEGSGTRAGYIAVGRPAIGSSSGNIMRFMIRSPLSDGTGYTSYYDSFTLPAPSAGNTDYGWYNIITTKNIDDIPDASATQAGKVSTGEQYIGGHKHFQGTALSLDNAETPTYGPRFYFRDSAHKASGNEVGTISALIMDNTTNITQHKFSIQLTSPKSDGTGYTTKVEAYFLPTVTNGLSASASYNILTTKNTKTYTASLTTAGWSSNTQTVTVTGMTADAIIMVSAAPASEAVYRHSGVYCSAQAANSLTFTCASTPTAAITVNILTIG